MAAFTGYHNTGHNSENNGSNGAPHSDDGGINWKEHSAFPTYMQYQGDRGSYCMEFELMLQVEVCHLSRLVCTSPGKA